MNRKIYNYLKNQWCGFVLFALIALNSCTQKKQTTYLFFEGEWISDSIYTQENDHWRELLYFDSTGTFNRTTFWGSSYILSKDLKLNDFSILDQNEEVFKIAVIDSTRIIVEGKNYYGRFNRNYLPHSNSYMADLNKIIISDKNRKQLLGIWKLVHSNLAIDDTAIQYREEYFKTPDYKKFADHPINDAMEISLDTNHFSIKSDSAETSYNYIINPENIDIDNTEYFAELDYSINDDTLVLNNSPIYGLTNTMLFVKKYN
ncbi:MAG TPA: hypothetical protein VLB84_11595 [Bacteroidia bacterium]|jgi:hypothetical protein|nr:hypothetical protein [Bacteroidia bacterium]